MPKTIQVRDVPDDAYDVLRERAAAAGFGLPEYLRREMIRMASRLDPDAALLRQRQIVEASDRHPTRAQILDALDTVRGS